MDRRRRMVIGGIAVLVVVASVLGAARLLRTDRSTQPEVASNLQATFVAATGVRTGAPTALTGSIVNTDASAHPVTLTVSDLPAGSSLASVLPSSTAPAEFGGWSCSGDVCTWVAIDGGTSLAARSAAPVLLALDGVAAGTSPSVTVSVEGIAPIAVALDLPDGAPALAPDAITLTVGGGGTVIGGTPATSTVLATNYSNAPIAVGALVVNATPPAISGLDLALAGSGWSCQQFTCSNTTAIAALSPSPPLTVTMSAQSVPAATEGVLSLTASATIDGAVVQSSASSTFTLRPARSWVVGTRVWIAPSSVVEGTTATATIEVAPTGQGSLTDTVDVSLDLPAGFTADWSSATSTGPWTCTSSGCTSNAPLTPGTQYLIDVPVAVAVGTTPGTRSLSVAADVITSEGSSPQKSSSTSVVVTPAAAASLRARLTGIDAVDPHGGSIGFSPGSERPLRITVTNEGSSPYRAGSTVFVSATPTSEEGLASAGGDGWSCTPSGGARVSSKHPLLCRSTLTSDLAPSASLTLPFALAANGVGASDWIVGVGTSRSTATANSVRARVEVQSHGPRFVPSVIEDSPIHDGGDGVLVARVINHGDRAATGGVITVSLPSAGAIVGVDAPAWSCIDASFVGTSGLLTCATTAVVAPGGSSPALYLSVAVSGHPKQIELSSWASAVGQFDAPGTAPTTSTFQVASAVQVDAGPDLTVTTPVVGANGVRAPAIVTLTGSSDLTSAKDLEWIQLCTQPDAPGCGGVVSPSVTWLGGTGGAPPTSLTARFTAPTQVTEPIDLFFRLTGTVGTTAISDDMVVHVMPATFVPSGGGGADAAAGGSSAGVPTPGTPPAPPAPTATIAGSGSTIQIPTRSPAQLVGGGTGLGPLAFAWAQVSGPTAVITGSSPSQPILQFTTPTLAPDQQSETLVFELTVSDATGSAATATATIDVVWGDDGLQVTLAGGAANVVTSIDGPISIASTVTSRGAPYTYDWTTEGLALPEGTVTGGSALSFDAGDSAADGSATLMVTDSFGRVTTVSIPVIVSALPAGQVPAALCDAISALGVGRSAQLSGAGVQITIESATLPMPVCDASAVIPFSSASATLPGAIAIASGSGQLTIAGVSFDDGAISVPSNWTVDAVTIPATGLLAPFVSSTAIGVPLGVLDASTSAFVAPLGWSGSASITFTSSPQPAATISSTALGTSPGQSLQISAVSVSGAVSGRMSGSGLVGIGPVDLPVDGTFATTSPTTSPVFSVRARLTTPAALGSGVSVSSADLAWSPAQSVGDVVLSIGTGPSALSLDSSSTVVDAAGTSFAFVATPTVWSSAPGAPTIALSGSGSVQGDQVTLSLTSAPVAPWSIGAQLTLQSVSVTVSLSCPLAATTSCGPAVTVGATATSPQLGAPATLSGALDPSTGIAALSGSAGSVTVAPLVVSNATLGVTIGPGTSPSAVATGSATVLGVDVPVSVTFGSESTVARAALGSVTIANGWTIAPATAIATTATLVYTTDVPAEGGTPTSTTIQPGTLIGVGVTQIPTNIASGVLPDDLQSGLVSFAIGSGPVSSYSLSLPLPEPWFVAGDAASDVSLSITSLVLTVSTSGSGVTIDASGAGLLTASPAMVGGVNSSMTMPFVGSLTPGAFTATFTAPSAPWASAFGAPGFTASNLQVQLSITQTSTSATLTGAMGVPTSLAVALGAPVAAMPGFTLDVTADTLCVTVDLSVGAPSASSTPNAGGDIGGYGFIEAPAAYIAVASGECDVSGVQVGAGISVLLDASSLGNLQFSVDPISDLLSGTFTDLAPVIGGVSFSDATVVVAQRAGAVPTITVTGTTTIAGQSVVVSSGIVQQQDGSAAFEFSSDVASLALDWVTIPEPEITISAPAVISATVGSTSVSVVGDLPVLGGVTVELTGTIENGSITVLAGAVASVARSLFGPDLLTAPLSVVFDQTQSPALTIGTPVEPVGTALGSLAIAEAPGSTRTYALTSLSVHSDGSLVVTASTTYLTEGISGQMSSAGTVTGTYSPASGNYSFTNPSNLVATLGGLPAPTTITLARSGGSVTAAQSSVLTPGIFDSDVSITVAGNLGVIPTSGTVTSTSASNTLSGNIPSAGLRGLSGSVSISVAAATNQAVTGLTAFENSVTYDSSSGCAMWQSDPTLQGVVYSANGTTYFTFAGTTPTILSLPAWWTSSSSRQQPVVISNEVVPGAPPATNGVTIAYPFSTSVYTGFGQVSFDFATCAFSVGGTALMSFNTLGPVGSALDQALSGPSGLQIQVGSLFGPSGELPPSVVVARALLQAEGLSTELAQLAEEENSAATLADRDVESYGNVVSLAQKDVEIAIQRVQSAQQAVDSATGQGGSAYGEAAGNLEAANADLQAAQRSASQAQATLVDAQAGLLSAQEGVERATSLQGEAQDASNSAKEAAAQYQEQSQEAAHPTLFQLTLQITYCSTCQTTFDISVDGQFNFAAYWVVDLGFALQIASSGVTAEVDIGGGIEKQGQASLGPVGASFTAELVLDLNFGLVFVPPDQPFEVSDFSATLQGDASVDVWASFWGVTLDAQLASVDIEASLQFVPWPAEWSASFEVQIGPFSDDLSYGPDTL